VAEVVSDLNRVFGLLVFGQQAAELQSEKSSVRSGSDKHQVRLPLTLMHMSNQRLMSTPRSLVASKSSDVAASPSVGKRSGH
jgi:hypothetical protein